MLLEKKKNGKMEKNENGDGIVLNRSRPRKKREKVIKKLFFATTLLKTLDVH